MIVIREYYYPMRTMKRNGFSAIVLALTLGGFAAAAPLSQEGGVFLMPMSCAELLQDPAPFLGYFEAVAKGQVSKDRKFSRRMFRILSMREKLGEATGRTREANPVDAIIRRTICFYREQKEPLKPVGFEDADFLKFMHVSLKELEDKVEDSIFQWEFERQQRREYERRLKITEGAAQTVAREAEVDADRAYDRLTNAARKKVQAQ